jgi:hypothetical protein
MPHRHPRDHQSCKVGICSTLDDCCVLHLLPCISCPHGNYWALWACEASEQVFIVESYGKNMSLMMVLVESGRGVK